MAKVFDQETENEASEGVSNSKDLLVSSELNIQDPHKKQGEYSVLGKLVPSSLSSCKKYLFGLVLVCLIACSWVGSTQSAKSAYIGDFKAPFFIMWFGTAWMISIFPIVIPIYIVVEKKSVKKLWRHSQRVFSPNGPTLKSILSSTVLFTTIWAVTNYMYSRALMSISATDVTALFSSAPAFVFILSVCILKEPPLILRLGSVVLVISGIVLFAYADGFKAANVVGIALSVGAAIGAAIYKVLLKWRVGDASLYQMALFLSSLGVFSTLFLWPIALILHMLGIEEISHVPWLFICISSALGVLFNFCINFGIAYTFPLFISIGTLLGIPLNAIVDLLIRQVNFFNWKFTATDFIVGGFMLMLTPPSDSLYIQRKIKKICCHK